MKSTIFLLFLILYHTLLNDMNGRIETLDNGMLPKVSEHNMLWSNYINQNYTFFNQREEEYWPPQGPDYPTGGWLQTAWYQSGIYNDFCSIDPATNLRSKVGCVATAISQILNFHEYIGSRVWNTANDGYISMEGETSEVYIDQDAGNYDFPKFSSQQGIYSPINTYLNDLRAEYLNANPEPTNDEIAALCYISGVACGMNYSSGGSGIYYSDYSNILTDKFNYYTVDWEWDLTSAYIANLIPNMKNAQPAIVNLINGPIGHSIVCDGYWINDEDEDFFHLNFGWGAGNPGGGLTPTNAWYDLPDFPFSYGFYNSPIYNISPPGCHGILSGTVSLNGGNGHITDVTITAGNKTTHPEATGYYEIELYNGNYEVSAYLFGYEKSTLEVEIIAEQNTNNIDFELQSVTANYLYVPTVYQTIQQAIEAAEDGDIVMVLPGEYFENINFNGKKIKVVYFYYSSQNESYIDNTIINGNNDGRVITFDSGEDLNSSLEGLTITGGNVSCGAGIRCDYSSPTLKNLKIINNEASHAAAIYTMFSEVVIKDVEVYNNLSTSTNLETCAINCNGNGVILINVAVYANNKNGIAINASYSNVIMENVSICDNGWKGIYLISELTMNNCLVWDNNNGGEQIYQGTNSTLSINYSDIQGGSPVTGIGNIDEEPQLDDNYKPLWTETEYSPLIDTGDPSIFDPDGTRSDIGAVRAINHKVETIELIETTEGINWLCFPVLDDIYADEDIATNVLYDIMLPPYPAALQLVETQDSENNIYYFLEDWLNADQQFTSVKGYKIHMNEAAALKITGFLENPYQTINLEGGEENWIGYFLEESMEPLDALEAVLDKIDMIQTRNFTLVKTIFGWIGTNEWTINYGDLVIVNCTEDCSFYWGKEGGGSVPKNTRSSSSGFSYNEESDYIPVFVELDPEALGNPTEIGIFVENECKGAAVIEDSLVQISAYVLNDSMVFDPGSVELQLYYGSRSENVLIDSYSIKENPDDAGKIEKLDFAKTQNRFYLISLNEPGNNVPGIIKTTLKQNYPNPFNPITTINYSIANEGNVELEVYNIKGQKVKTLINELKESGHYQAIWNGTDNNKKQVASGIYFYRLTFCKKTLNKKMLLLK